MTTELSAASTTGTDVATAAVLLSELLHLTHPPVGMAFLADPPAGVAVREEVAPSACAFWRLAEQAPFFAPAHTHLGCAVGAMVLGLPLDEDAQARLGTTVAAMTGSGYLDGAEPAAIPTRSAPAQGVLYGPLADFPGTPDLVLSWISPRAGMLLAEAAEAASWTGSRGLTLTGRPGCAALPLAEQSRSVAASLGCAGLRRFTGIDDGLMLAVLPGAHLDDYLTALAGAAAVNTVMDDFYACASGRSTGPSPDRDHPAANSRER